MNGASPTPQAASRMIRNMHMHVRVGARLGAVYVYTGLVCTLRMRVPVPVLVLVPYRTAPYRGRAPRFANHGSVIECM